MMRFVTVRDFRNSSREVWDKVSKNDEVVVTNNGKPTAILINVSEESLEETIASIRQARAMRDFNRLREKAAERGFLTEDEINEEILKYRTEKRNKLQEECV